MADTIFELYPFHILLNETMEILSIGRGLKHIFPKALREDFSSLFEFIRPEIEPTMKNIQNHLNNIFELNCSLSRSVGNNNSNNNNNNTSANMDPEAISGPKTAKGSVEPILAAMESKGSIMKSSDHSLRTTEEQTNNDLVLKGQMIYFDEWNCIMFVGFPLLMNPEQMMRYGLYLSDLSLFDSSRDLVMAAAQEAADRQLTQKLLSVKTDVVSEAHHMSEKAKSEWQKTHYALLPTSIMQRFLKAEPAYAMSQVFDLASCISVEIVDKRLCDADKATFTLVEEVHKLAQEICNKYGLQKIDGRLTDFLMLAGVPDQMKNPEVCALRAANALAGSFDVRIGVSTGRVAAGIVGCKLLTYK